VLRRDRAAGFFCLPAMLDSLAARFGPRPATRLVMDARQRALQQVVGQPEHGRLEGDGAAP